MMAETAETMPLGPYVVLGGPPFESTANQTSLQMFEAIGAQRPILYVCRRYQGSIIRRWLKGALGKTSTTLTPGLRRLDSNRFVLVLPWFVDFLPLIRPELSRKTVTLLIGLSLRRTLATLGWEKPTLIAYWWMLPEIVRLDIWHHRVFDVIDRHWGYAYERDDRARKRNFHLAVETALASDRIMCVSKGLVTELRSVVHAQLLPNGIDLERVNRCIARDSGQRRKMAVYAGGWNERLDVELLMELVTRNPDWQFAFVGAATDQRFMHFSNVTFYGDVPYDTVLQVLCQAKIGLIPFVANSFTESSSFLKILDYMACGVTVGATNLSSLQEWHDNHPERFKILDDLEGWDNLFERAGERKGFYSGKESSDFLRYGTVRRALSLVSSQ